MRTRKIYPKTTLQRTVLRPLVNLRLNGKEEVVKAEEPNACLLPKHCIKDKEDLKKGRLGIKNS